MSNRVLITGGAGFIGSNLVHHFNRESPETEIVVLDDLSTGLARNLRFSTHKFLKGSILNRRLLRKSAEGADSIVHLAAMGSVPRSILAPRPTHDANITGTLNVLEVARELGIPHVVVASSSSVYGANPALPKDETDWTRPLSPYAVSKLATESYALAYGSSYGLETLALRFFNVYGPRQRADHLYAAVVPKFIAAAASRTALSVHGDGNQSRDFTFVGSVCSALVQSVNNRITSATPINLAFGNSTSLLGLVGLLQEFFPHQLRLDFTPTRAGDVRASQANPERMRALFPDLKPVDLSRGIRETVDWYVNEANP